MLNNLKDLLKHKISEVKNGQRFFVGDEEYLRLAKEVEATVLDSTEGRVYLKLADATIALFDDETEVTGENFGVPLKDLKVGDYFIDSDGTLCHIRGKSDSACHINFLGGEDTIYVLSRRVKTVEVTVEDGVVKIIVE